MKLLETSGLDSSRASVLLNLLWHCLCSRWLGLSQDVLVSLSPLKCLRKASIYRNFGGGWVTHGRVWLVIHIIAWLVRLCARLHISSLTRAGLPMSSLTHADVWLDMAKRAGRVNRVAGQNGSFLNRSIGLWVKRVAGWVGSSWPVFFKFFFFFWSRCNLSIVYEFLNYN